MAETYVKPHINWPESFDEVFENAAVVLLLVDADGRVIHCNRSLAEKTGKTSDLILGRLAGEVFNCANAWKGNEIVCGKGNTCKSCAVRSRITHTFNTGIEHFKENGKLTINKDGKDVVLDLLISTALIKIEGNEYVLLSIDDISQIKSQERKLNELIRDKDRFLSILSHDLRSPLAGILSTTRLLLEEYDSFNEKDIKDALGMLLDSGESALELLTNLLIWTRSKAGRLPFNPIQVDLLQTLQKIRLEVGAHLKVKNIRIYVEIDKTKKWVFADTSMLETIIRNLLQNSIKFTNEGGEIYVSNKSDEFSNLIIIRDTGIGMSKSRLRELRKQEYVKSMSGTEGEKGSGMGLSMCREFMSQHDGSLTISSEEGKGTQITLGFPKH